MLELSPEAGETDRNGVSDKDRSGLSLVGAFAQRDRLAGRLSSSSSLLSHRSMTSCRQPHLYSTHDWAGSCLDDNRSGFSARAETL